MDLKGRVEDASIASSISRRALLKGSAAFALASSSMGSRAMAGVKETRMLAYVGTDTKHIDSAANGQGIYLFEINRTTGQLSLLRLVSNAVNATWLVFHPSGRHLYAIHEIESYQGKNGSVSAFAVDRDSGSLRLLNTVSSRGAGPAYLSLDLTGRFAFVANYYGGNIAVLPIRPDGSLGEAVDVHQDRGDLGSIHAASAPPGSFAISGHHSPHAHMIHPGPENRFVLQTDLGQDRIYIYRFDSSSGKLTPASIPFVSLPTGDGPRHFTFHPNHKWMYSIQEEASTLAFFHYNPRTGALNLQKEVSSLPPGFAGTNFGSEIMISPDGRFLYAGNRLHNSVGIFRIAENGDPRWIGDTWVRGDYPSQFNMDPSGNFLYSCNQRSDQITSFRIDKGTGQMSFTGQYAPVGTPLCIAFLR